MKHAREGLRDFHRLQGADQRWQSRFLAATQTIEDSATACCCRTLPNKLPCGITEIPMAQRADQLSVGKPWPVHPLRDTSQWNAGSPARVNVNG